MPQPAILHPLFDELFRLRRPDREARISRARSAIEAFPDLAALDHERLVRSVAVADVLTRAMFRSYARFAFVTKALVRIVPVVGPRWLIAKAPSDRPLIVALMHFGEIHFVIAVAVRLLGRRPVYVLHAGGETGHAASAFLRRIGATPVVTDRGALEVVREALTRDSRSAVVVCFDHLSGRGRQDVNFLGRRLPVPTGISYLAGAAGANVVTCWLEAARFGPRFRVGTMDQVDPSLERSAGEAALIDRLFAAVEKRVRAAPGDWTEWPNCFGDERIVFKSPDTPRLEALLESGHAALEEARAGDAASV